MKRAGPPSAADYARIIRAERILVDLVRECATWHSFCSECGPNVKVDEDGLCGACGGSSMGAGVDGWRQLAVQALARAYPEVKP